MKIFASNPKQKTQFRIINLVITGFFALFFWWIFTLPSAPLPEQNPGSQENAVAANTKPVTPDIFNEAWIKSLSSDIEEISLSPYTANHGKTFLDTGRVEITLNTKVLWGGAQDWNKVANDIFTLSKQLLTRKEPAVIHFIFRSTENNNVDWARIVVERKKLPKNWQELTYLQFFGLSKPIPQNLQTGEWLCDFYKKYESARANGKFPEFCNNESDEH